MRRRVLAAILALVLLPVGLWVLYAANANPPLSGVSCSIGFSGERGTVHLNQDGTVNYTFLCTTAKYATETFLVLNVAALTTVWIGIRNLRTAVRG
ncbi:hypothetical protein [Halococcus agarilyticus]|uniref:hypothetical protein n=1 Tax=Halococcus agarilyticus TaxID=1232219 RepID=UPI0006776514|nr:hypothetical protein [Halococcus agarilyticus]